MSKYALPGATEFTGSSSLARRVRFRRAFGYFALLTAPALCLACRTNTPRGALGGDVSRGKTTIAEVGCGVCHTIDGVFGATSAAAPSLAGIANRAFIAGRMPNTPENMLRWILRPDSIEPDVKMPRLGDARRQNARDIVAYLYTLK